MATTTDTEEKKWGEAAYKEQVKIAKAVGASRRRASIRGRSYKKNPHIRMTFGRG